MFVGIGNVYLLESQLIFQGIINVRISVIALYIFRFTSHEVLTSKKFLTGLYMLTKMNDIMIRKCLSWSCFL